MSNGSRTPEPVLLLVRELGIGGIERDVTKLAMSLDRNQFEPHVGCFYARGLRFAELRDAGVPIVELPVRSLRSPSVVTAACVMLRYIHQHRINLVHCYDVPTIEFGVPAAKFSRARAIVSSQLGYRDLFTNLDRRLLRFTDRLVDRIHVNCEAMRRHLIDDERVSAARIHLCYNGVDTSVFFPRQQPKPELLSGAEVVIGTVCALRPEKRVDLLIDAFAMVRHVRPGLKLLIVGSGPLLESLLSRAASIGMLEQTVFVPATSDVADWMRTIDIYALPSDSEAFSNALLEAMASGCCPIGSRVGGTPEQIDDGRNGFLFERGEAGDFARKLELAITNTNRRKQMGSAAAASARERFSITRAADGMGSLYKSLLQPRRSSRPTAGTA